MTQQLKSAGLVVKAGAEHPTLKDDTGHPLIDMNKFEAYLKELAVKHVQEAADRIGVWTAEAKAANETLKTEMDGVGFVLERAKDMKKEFIDTLRSMRSVSNTEVSALMKPLEDVRRFFLSDAHTKEVEQLKEFIELCERLQKLKESGFLDTVADTMLKLS